MSSQQKVSDDDLIVSYRRHGNIWKTGLELGLAGQTVQKRLVSLGIPRNMRKFTEYDNQVLRAEYFAAVESGNLDDLAKKLGRTKQFICRKARALGLTGIVKRKYTTEEIAKRGAAVREWQKRNGHPRGMAGKHHTPELCKRLGLMHRDRWLFMSEDQRAQQVMKSMKARHEKGILVHPRPNATWKADWREIGGVRKYYRSRWEANYARYLEWLKQRGIIKNWEHEPQTFWFDAVKRGTRSYLPDFRVTELNGAVVFHEVKGWMDERSKTKLKRMKKYHPHIKLIVIDKTVYASIASKVARLIEGWE